MSYIGRVEQKASDVRRFNVTGSTSATHTLTWTAPNEQSLIITINGVKQQEDAYSVSGVTLTLTSPLVSTDKMEVVGILDIGEAVTPPDDSISTIKIQDDAVTADKLASGLANATHTGDVTGATALTIANDAVDIAMLSATGTASATTFLRGDNAWAAAGGGFNSVQVFTSSGTWTRPSGVTKVIMEVQGAGGGGSQNASINDRCISGAAGGYAKKFLDVSSISTSTIPVGAAGSGGSSDVGTVGGNSSWADGTNTITGAASATAASATDTKQVVVGGTATGGDINIPGQVGGPVNDGWGPSDSMLGKGGGFASSGYYAAGENDATGYGAGGGGSGDYRGGNGAPGIVIVWEYK